mmetsp:Transcript_114828/g.335838  ORF Transcript_114828/g.335838 Transcript_114828/m.335838 type:complete len:491 (+) Transcript_114828:160-1632(+)
MAWCMDSLLECVAKLYAVEAWLLSSPARAFYGIQAGTLLALWLAVKAGSGVDMLRLAPQLSNVALRPSWLPRCAFLWTLRRQTYYPCAYCLIPLLFLAAAYPTKLALRFAVAMTATLFHVAESSRTTSHRDYLMVYNCWGLTLCCGQGSDSIAQALGLGFCLSYIFGSGLAKLFIGGVEWGGPGTLQAILQTFAKKGSKEGGPILRGLNRIVSSNALLAAACGCFTLAFECVAAPLAFVVPMHLRIVYCYGMLVLHIGIAALQSGAIGAFFLPCAASYVFGLHMFESSDLNVGSPGWFLALGVFALLTLSGPLLRRRLLPEDWPLTPFALFPWSGSQWQALHRTFVDGNTRLVLTTDIADPMGLRVFQLEHRACQREGQGNDGADADRPTAAYCAWNRVVGVTTLQNELLEALQPEFAAMTGKHWDASCFVSAVEGWLARGRMVEISSGKALARAFLVTVRDDHVDEVVCTGTPAAKQPLLHGSQHSLGA